jgi:AcrR family transcriptional regulator
MTAGTAPRSPGRPRDEAVTEAITRATLRQLRTIGYGNLTMEGVATESGVSRTTVYRRHPHKADLVTAAIASEANVAYRPLPAAAPRQDLVTFLEAFDATFAESCITVLGALIAAREEPEALALHRERVIAPRVEHVRALLARAAAEGAIAEDADIDLATTMLLGGIIARRICGIGNEPGWAARAVALAWEGLASPAHH